MASRSTATANVLLGELLTSIVWFPVWWYTTGLRRVTERAVEALRYRVESYSFRVWLKNFFVPMYGQTDITGRLVSVFMRFVVLIGRSIALFVEALIYLAGLFAWTLAPFIFAMFVALNVITAGTGGVAL